MRTRSLQCSLFLGAAVAFALCGLSKAQETEYTEAERLGMESHIGHLTGHARAAAMNYRRYCTGCHGDLGDGEGENAQWLDPKPRNFTLGQFKCRSTPTGTLPTDQDLYNTVGRGLMNSNMPQWLPLTDQGRADLVAWSSTFRQDSRTKNRGRQLRCRLNLRLRQTGSSPVRLSSKSWNAGNVMAWKASPTDLRRTLSPTTKTGRLRPLTSMTVLASSAGARTRISTKFS